MNIAPSRSVDVEIHSKDACPFCEKSKAYHTTHNIPFVEIRHDDQTERNIFYDSLGLVGDARTVPQIFLIDTDGERMWMGGYDKLSISGLDSLFPQKRS